MPSIETDIKFDFKDVLIRPKRSFLSSRSEVSLEREIQFKHSGKTWKGVPIIAANMDTIGTFELARVLGERKMITAIHKHYSVEEWLTFSKSYPEILPYVAVSCGISEQDQTKLGQILEQDIFLTQIKNTITGPGANANGTNSKTQTQQTETGIQFICIDVANGYSQKFVNFIRNTRSKFPKHTIIAGNVVTKDMSEELIMSGADIIKVGIGPGSVCTTRKQTGVGYPQLSAVLDCADAAHGLGGKIISDGGCVCPGDLSKAFGAGADFVMLGGMLAGHDECAGEVEYDPLNPEKILYKVFYGMSSDTAMKKHSGGVAEYRSSEGKTVKVPYRGKICDTLNDICGGIRSTCTYVGAKEIRELPKRTTFIRVSMQLNQVFGAS